MRVGRKGEEDVFPERLCQVHDFSSIQVRLTGKVFENHRKVKVFEARNARRPERRPKGARGENPPVAEPDVQRVAQRGAGHRQAVFQSKGFRRVFPFNVFPFRRDLQDMNFHGGLMGVCAGAPDPRGDARLIAGHRLRIAQSFHDALWHKTPHIATQSGDFLHHP